MNSEYVKTRKVLIKGRVSCFQGSLSTDILKPHMHSSPRVLRTSVCSKLSSSGCRSLRTLASPSLRAHTSTPFSCSSRLSSVAVLASPGRSFSVSSTAWQNPTNAGASSSTSPHVVEPSETHFSANSETPSVYGFFEDVTSTWQYIVVDEQRREAVVIDPVLDYNPVTGKVTTQNADKLLSFIHQHSLDVRHIL